MRFVDKILDIIFKERKKHVEYTELEGYADYLIFTLEDLKIKENNKIGRLLPGGFTYYSYMEQTINNIKILHKKKIMPDDLAWQRLEHLAEKISEALETFEKTQWK